MVRKYAWYFTISSFKQRKVLEKKKIDEIESYLRYILEQENCQLMNQLKNLMTEMHSPEEFAAILRGFYIGILFGLSYGNITVW